MRDALVEKLKDEFGDRLISVGLHNVGVTSFIEKNGLFVVLDAVEPEDIFAVKRVYIKYKKNFTTPLVVDEHFFENSKDVFCMEILEMKENSEIIYGKNPFKNIEISDDDLKSQIKHELFSKFLALKGAFVDLPLERKVIDSITYRSLYNFLLIMRNMLRLKDKLINDETLIEKFEEMFDVKLEAFKTLRDSSKMPFDRLIEVFKKYLKEIETIEKVFNTHFS
ncbi:hypothetical protein [Hippea alviniae]|uniref:hypothetical protein n=1 Tax=Hippea alviniae TaxID=1279027 RepID=UPI0003B2E8E7|nr:hypothetical protein [Hippea alviniae]